MGNVPKPKTLASIYFRLSFDNVRGSLVVWQRVRVWGRRASRLAPTHWTIAGAVSHDQHEFFTHFLRKVFGQLPCWGPNNQ